MDITEHVKEFRTLQKNQKIRVADFCRERMLDYYEMVEALKKDKFLSELPKEEIEMGEVEITDYPLERPDQKLQIDAIELGSVQERNQLSEYIFVYVQNKIGFVSPARRYEAPTVVLPPQM